MAKFGFNLITEDKMKTWLVAAAFIFPISNVVVADDLSAEITYSDDVTVVDDTFEATITENAVVIESEDSPTVGETVDDDVLTANGYFPSSEDRNTTYLSPVLGFTSSGEVVTDPSQIFE